MLLDAEAGRFGPPVVLPIACFNTAAFTSCLVYRGKVERFKAEPKLLTKPALIAQHDDGSIMAVFDGRHRLTAAREIGQSNFSAWSVPLALVGNYMLRPELVTNAAAAILATADHEETFSDDLERPWKR